MRREKRENNLTIETQRLILRPVSEDDCDDLFLSYSHSEVGYNAGWEPHKTREETLQIMREIFINRQNIWGIVERHTKICMGTIGLTEDPKRQNTKAKMIGYAIGPQFWGKGYMTESCEAVVKYGFETLGMDILSAYCYPNNSRSRRVIEKVGMSYEGLLRQAEELYTGEVLDNLCFSIAKQEHLLEKCR